MVSRWKKLFLDEPSSPFPDESSSPFSRWKKRFKDDFEAPLYIELSERITTSKSG